MEELILPQKIHLIFRQYTISLTLIQSYELICTYNYSGLYQILLQGTVFEAVT